MLTFLLTRVNMPCIWRIIEELMDLSNTNQLPLIISRENLPVLLSSLALINMIHRSLLFCWMVSTKIFQMWSNGGGQHWIKHNNLYSLDTLIVLYKLSVVDIYLCHGINQLNIVLLIHHCLRAFIQNLGTRM